jgi:TolB-like protein
MYYNIILILLSVCLTVSAQAHTDQEKQADPTALYEAGQYQQVIDLLKGQKFLPPSAALYLGLSQLRLENLDDAILAWKGYVETNPGSEAAREIAGYTTLLLQEASQRLAKKAQEEESAITTNPPDPNAIAVSPFLNLGSPDLAPLSKGLAQMVMTDLSLVPSLKVVERIRLQAVVDELKLAQSGLVEEASAAKAGRLLGAGNIATGSFLDLQQEEIHLDTRITQTETGKSLMAHKTEGKLDLFYQVQKNMVFKILCGLGRCPESLDPSVVQALEKVHTTSLEAFLLYSKGLDLLDQGRYREAAQAFYLALEKDPNFTLAQRALVETPHVNLTLNAIIKSGEQLAKASSIEGPQGAISFITPPDTHDEQAGFGRKQSEGVGSSERKEAHSEEAVNEVLGKPEYSGPPFLPPIPQRSTLPTDTAVPVNIRVQF